MQSSPFPHVCTRCLQIEFASHSTCDDIVFHSVRFSAQRQVMSHLTRNSSTGTLSLPLYSFNTLELRDSINFRGLRSEINFCKFSMTPFFVRVFISNSTTTKRCEQRSTTSIKGGVLGNLDTQQVTAELAKDNYDKARKGITLLDGGRRTFDRARDDPAEWDITGASPWIARLDSSLNIIPSSAKSLRIEILLIQLLLCSLLLVDFSHFSHLLRARPARDAHKKSSICSTLTG